MSLDILKAVKLVSGSSELRGALSGAYFCSAITFIEPGKHADYWDLNYFRPEKNEIMHVHVSENSVELKSSDKPLKQRIPEEINLKSIRIGIDKSLEIASKLQAKEEKSAVQRVFASLYSEGAAVWSISFILSGMKIFQVKIDARDGRIIDSKVHEFMQKNLVAS